MTMKKFMVHLNKTGLDGVFGGGARHFLLIVYLVDY
jgi:hypothetical protein